MHAGCVLWWHLLPLSPISCPISLSILLMVLSGLAFFFSPWVNFHLHSSCRDFGLKTNYRMISQGTRVTSSSRIWADSLPVLPFLFQFLPWLPVISPPPWLWVLNLQSVQENQLHHLSCDQTLFRPPFLDCQEKRQMLLKICEPSDPARCGVDKALN